MKVKAEHWVKYNGTWHAPGEEYEYGAPVVDELEKPEEHEEPVAEPMAEPVPEKETSRRGRKRRTEE